MDAQTVTIEVQGTSYGMKFGYGALRMLGKNWKCDDLQEVFSRLGKLGDFSTGKLGFEALDTIGDITLAAIAVGDNPDYDFDRNELVNVLMKNPDKMGEVITAFVASMPNQEPEGAKKKKAPVKKQTRIKKS
jgi:hypothetical protein